MNILLNVNLIILNVYQISKPMRSFSFLPQFNAKIFRLIKLNENWLNIEKIIA